jgi:hypothetical protein
VEQKPQKLEMLSMYRIRTLLAVAAILVAGPALAQLPPEAVELDKVKIPEKLKTEDFCPVYLEPADPDIPTWEYDGVTYGGAKADAQAKFESDPEKYVKAYEENRWVANFVQAMSTVWCPVTDEITPGGMLQWDKLGYKWESCCTFCNETVDDSQFPRALKKLKERGAEAYAKQDGKYTEGASSPVEGAINFNPDAGAGGVAAMETPEPDYLADADLKPTYTEGVGLVMEKRCLECHRVGGVAPMSFMTYGEIMKWKKNFKETLSNRTMPPWPADPSIGQFGNSKRLSDKELDLLIAWADAGYPQGEGEYTLGDEFMSEWLIGEPDEVFELGAYTVPETVAEEIKTFEVKTDLDEDKWVVAAEGKPEDTFLVFAIDGGPLGEYHLGNAAQYAPEGYAWLLKAGEPVNVDVFYMKEKGWEAFENTKVAVKFGEGDYTALQFDAMSADDLAIAAGAKDVEASASFEFPADGKIVALTPVMRQRGKSVKYVAKTPDGTETELLSIPRWDPNWNFTYQLAEPMAAPKGTVVTVTGVYDNSEDNPLNPDPSKDLKAGPNGEVLEGRIDYALD